MKKQTLLWLVVVLMCGVFAVPKTAFARDDGNYDRHHLQGRWYMNGDPNKPAEIHADRRGLEAKNENGQTSRLEVDRGGKIRAPDWQDMRGSVRGNRIEWANGTTWTRRPSERTGRR